MKQTAATPPVVFNERVEKREFWQGFESRMRASQRSRPTAKPALENKVKKS